jgi:NAD(P)-dependent dehydrogenase (short-subunit alcohol dehydrogenase family)
VAIEAAVTTAAQAQDAISRCAEAFGGLDIYVDAGFGTFPKAFREAGAIDSLDEAFATNLRTPLLMTHGLMRFLENRKRGRIIYLLHDVARLGIQGHSLLAATRMGLIQFVKALARESADKGLTANCVAMGVTEDFLLASQAPAPASIQAAFAELAKSFPGAPAMDSERIASLVAFLASPLSSGITGQTIAASQGLSYLG